MQNLKTKMFVLGIGSLLVLTVGCAKPPTAELTAAETALNAARNAEAATYAPEAWSEAEAAMNAAKTEIAAQDGKFALLRSYTQAQQLLTTTESVAKSAEVAGNDGREQARSEAEAALLQVIADLDEASLVLSELANCPRKPKGFAQDLELLKGNLAGLAASLPDVEAAFAKDQFKETMSLASALSGEVAVFTEELTTAKSKIKC